MDHKGGLFCSTVKRVWISKLPFGELLTILLAVCTSLAAKPLVRLLIGESMRREVYNFEARGVIVAPWNSSSHRNLRSLCIWRSEQCGMPTDPRDKDGRLNDLWISLDPAVLRPGARFEKEPGTFDCTVDGFSYVLYEDSLVERLVLYLQDLVAHRKRS
jgi:hypothetical protein